MKTKLLSFDIKTILFFTFLFGLNLSFGQNMNDNKVSFSYIQLPMIQIDAKFSKYEVRIDHDYRRANEDSLALNALRKEASLATYKQLIKQYQDKRDSLDRTYLKKLSTWEKGINSGATNADGTPLTKPAPSMYPEPPLYPVIGNPRLNTEYADNKITSAIDLQGFDKGLGGFVVTIIVHPLQNQPIIQSKKGSGAATKYTYRAPYSLPITVKIESPTQGVLLEKMLFTELKNYKMKDQKSQYDHTLYMLDNKDEFYLDLEEYARKEAMNSANSYLNGQLGFVSVNRSAEVYTVKRYKKYNYSDVDYAFKKTVTAFQAIKNDEDRSGAADMLEDALAAWDEVLLESNNYDKTARINTKVSAMIECNRAEILVWLAEFDKANSIISLLINSDEGKAKRHANLQQSFYEDQRLRWNANY